MRNRRAILSGVLLLVGAAVVAWWLVGHHRGKGRTATSDGRAPGAGALLASSRGAPSALPDARQQTRGEIRGTVREQGGGPIAGAQVCSSWWADGVASADRREPTCTRSDAAGAYRLAGLVPGRHEVSASAPGHAPAGWIAPRGEDDTIHLAPGQVRDGVDLVLAPGGVEVKGIVEDVSGGPIADARVSVASDSWWRRGSSYGRSDAQGHFSLWAAPGAARLTAEAEGYAAGEANAVAPAQAVEILLTPESSLGGVVVDADSRAPVADVLVQVGDGEGDDSFGWGGGDSARTDAQGRFRLERLKPGRYKPTASGRGVYGEPADSVLLGLGQHVDDVTIEVHPARIVSGRIEIADGDARRPCARGWLSLHGTDNGRRANDRTDDDGQVELTAVRAGRYEVSVRCDGQLEQDHYDPIVVADHDITGVVWTVSTGGSVRGVVRTAAGDPVPDVEVSAETTGVAARAQRSWGYDLSRDDGSFLLTGLVAGEYALHVWSDEQRGPEPPPKVTVAIGKETQADVVLAASGMVAGDVVDTDGKPVSGAQVRVMSGRFFMGGGSTRSDESGHFLVKGVEPGDRRVIASRGWSDQLRKPGTTDDDVQGEKVKVVAGKTATVHLVVESRSGTISGTVKDDTGAAVVDAWVVASRESDAAGALAGQAARETRWTWDRDDRPVVTDTGGAFTVRELSPGTYTVRAFRRGGGEAVAEHVAIGGSVALVIRATGLVGGTVTTADGHPVDEFDVTVSDVKTGFSRSESFYMTAGRFTMRDLPAGNFVVAADATAGRAQASVTLAAGEQRADLALVLQGSVVVRGRIVDVDGNAPVAGLSARVTAREGGDNRFTFTFGDDGDRKNISGDDGTFEVARAPAGKDYLIAFPVDFGESTYGIVRYPITVAAGAGVVDVGDIPTVKRRVKFGDEGGDLGLTFADQPPDTEPEAYQLKVSNVRAGGPGEAAGVKVGDVVVSIDGHDIRGARSMLGWNLIEVPVGTKVVLGLARGTDVTVTAGPPP
ncbi:MAG TPA: carboxypeptidase regulatory-like domain-containing protein [Kofleriaceae bacterium]|nr:carboxypeptidase regulatory-like domain-containing protein [Kofleriaceae bacterium]